MRVAIIGNSAAGLSALEAFRRIDQESTVTVISKELGEPYSRVLLPYFLRGRIPYPNFFIRDEGYFARHKAECLRDRVVKVDPHRQHVMLETGRDLGVRPALGCHRIVADPAAYSRDRGRWNL